MPRDRLEEGVYKGSIRKWGVEEHSPGKKRFYIELTVTAFYGEDAEGEPVVFDRKMVRTVYRYFTVDSVGILKRDLESLGYNMDWGFARINPNHPKAFPFAGIETFLKLSYQEYKGKENEKWDIYRSRKRGAAVDIDQWIQDADELDAVLAASESQEDLPEELKEE